MSNQVPSLETCQKLKAAGFPQETRMYWGEHPGGTHSLEVVGYKSGEGDDYFSVEVYAKLFQYTLSAAPTAQELADQLPRLLQIDESGHMGLLTIKSGPTTEWGAAYFYGADPFLTAIGDSMAEALAQLYIKVKGGK